MRRTFFLRGLTVFAASVVVGQLVSRATSGALDRGGPLLGTVAPEPALVTLEGSPVTLESLRGHVAVLNFWATWCPGCRSEMPALAQFAAAPSHHSLRLVGVSMEEPDVLKAFASKRAPGYPFSSSPGALERRLEIQALPTTVILDATGHVVARHVGSMTQDELEAIVRPVIGTSHC